MKATLPLLAGHDIAPEVVAQARLLLDAIAAHDFTLEEALIGGAAIDAISNPLPAATTPCANVPMRYC